MAMKFLGDTYDIHTSGIDLVFPHHENTIAISHAVTGKPVANYWLHNELVMVNGKKPSHSSNNDPFTIRSLLEEGYTGRDIRYWLMSRHYRKPIVFTRSKLDTAKNTLFHLDAFVKKLSYCRSGAPNADMDQLVYNFRHKFTSSLDDDLNMAPALAALFEFTRQINPIMDKDGLADQDQQKVKDVLESINSVLGVLDMEPSEPDSKVEELVNKREAARKNKDWASADRIRHDLKKMGIELIDTKDGPLWRKEKGKR
jgi:cysteinyl-tRNA synthetase